ncbi:MAG: hypothetical protein HC904_13855 [Blastochloris sp.]|nr:hypothetical protein [Blastochloris sp.]
MAKARQFKEFLPAILSKPPGGTPATVIGGQAVNYWCELAQNKNPELATQKPFTSFDLDLVAHERSQTLAIAHATGLKLIEVGQAYSGSDRAALVDPKTKDTLIQILGSMYGVSDKVLGSNTADVVIEDSQGVEHPAKIANRTVLIVGKIALALAPDNVRKPEDKEHDRHHLRLLILCMATATRELTEGIGKDHDERFVIKSLKALLKVIRSKDAVKVSSLDQNILWQNAIAPEILRVDASRYPSLAKFVSREIAP